MWKFVKVNGSYNLWFSDGKPIDIIRGGHGISSRLIVDRQGFLDLTELDFDKWTILDANGLELMVTDADELGPSIELSLIIPGDGTFTLSFTMMRSQNIEASLIISILHSFYTNLLVYRS
jgi:hypothetical protein